MSKHLVDHRKPSQGGRVKQFLRIARKVRGTWHRSEAKAGSARVVHYCRIERGQEA
jgi:hypothetical protein